MNKLLIAEANLRQNAVNWYRIVNYFCNDYDSFKLLVSEKLGIRDIQRVEPMFNGQMSVWGRIK